MFHRPAWAPARRCEIDLTSVQLPNYDLHRGLFGSGIRRERSHVVYDQTGPRPVFLSGLHADYHKPSDTADKIDAKDAAKLLEYIAELTDRSRAIQIGRIYPRGAKPLLPFPTAAAVPDTDRISAAFRISTNVRKACGSRDVRDGTPAAKAGLKAGDILIEFDGKAIGNLYDFTYALRAHKAGDLVLVKVLRGSQTIEAKVLLTERR